MLFAALAIVLLLQVGTQFDTAVGTVSEGGTYGPLHSGPARVRKSSGVKQAERAKLRNPSASASRSSAKASSSQAASSVRSSVASSVASSAASSSAVNPYDEFIAKGTGPCLNDRTCKNKVSAFINAYECASDAKCLGVSRSYWLQTQLAPECMTNAQTCADVDTLVRIGLNDNEQKCLNDQMCRGMLAEFRMGEVGCIRYEPCHTALQSLMKRSECAASNWCGTLSWLHTYYATHIAECANPDSATCKTAEVKNKLGRNNYSSDECQMDKQCHRALINIDAELIGNDATSACYLWKSCRDYMVMNKRWACETVKRADYCKMYGGYLQFFQDKPTCVALSYTQSCQDGLKKAMGK